jgi:hypothetical protein
MRRGSLFWGSILILIGVLLLLDNLNIIPSFWKLFWPLLLIALGLWLVLKTTSRRRGFTEMQQASIALGDAQRARVRVDFGAGRLSIHSGAHSGELVIGTFGGGLDYHARREGDLLDVEMSMPKHAFPRFFLPWTWWDSQGAFHWSFSLNREIPIVLELKTGASETCLDLSELRITELRLKTGASSTRLTLPAHAGHTRASIKAGAASLNIQIPSGVAARIRIDGSLAGVHVDTGRFPRVGNAYQSSDYETAANRADITAEIGAGSIDIR